MSSPVLHDTFFVCCIFFNVHYIIFLFKIAFTKNIFTISTVDGHFILNPGLQYRRVLMEVPNHCLPVNELQKRYKHIHYIKYVLKNTKYDSC